MKIVIPKKLNKLANMLDKPLYIVGGFCRNYLINGMISNDIDLASPIKNSELVPFLKRVGFSVCATYKNTGTLFIKDGDKKYEFTTFRIDEYAGGHKPKQTTYTDNIVLDAKRRDFTCNAIYYDIKNQEFVDPLNGIRDIKNKVINTVVSPKLVFGVDGLRLMRLVRFYAELGFSIKKEVINGAKENADKIDDISLERIYTELKYILYADKKYQFSPKNAHYLGVKMLDEIGVLDRIIPELKAGKGMIQNAKYHIYDVFNHSLKCMEYSNQNRLIALLHDIGKPYCYKENGNFDNHNKVSEKIAKIILDRLRAEREEIKRASFLIYNHMLGIKEKMSDIDKTKFLVKNYKFSKDLIELMKADSLSGLDDGKIGENVIGFQKAYDSIAGQNIPQSIKELKISGEDLKALGFRGRGIGRCLEDIFSLSIENPKLNEHNKLIEIAKSMANDNKTFDKDTKFC